MVYQNCKFHEPWGRGSCARAWLYKSYSENALFLLKSFSLLSQTLTRQTRYIIMMTKEGSTKIVNHYYSEYVLSCFSINRLNIDCYWVKRLWCCFPIPLLICNYSIMGLLMCKYVPFWQKFLILRWLLRPLGLLYWLPVVRL